MTMKNRSLRSYINRSNPRQRHKYTKGHCQLIIRSQTFLVFKFGR